MGLEESLLTPACHAVARQSVGGTPETLFEGDVLAIMRFSFDSRVGSAVLAGMVGETEQSRFYLEY
jgi:hypothetical protein